MSAPVGCSLNRAALLTWATKVTACDVFRVEAGGSAHHCADCGATTLAHVVVALRQSCGTCAHGNDSETVGIGHTHCTRHGGEWNGHLLPIVGRCEAWEPLP